MPKPVYLSREQSQLANEAISTHGIMKAARLAGVNRITLSRAANHRPVSHSTALAIEQLRSAVKKTKTAEDFGAVAMSALRQPRKTQPSYSWPLESIRAARDAQMRGQFATPARLAEAMRLDDALFTAYHNRIAPQSAVEATLESAGGARGDAVKKRALESIVTPRSVLAGINGTMANHGIAIGYVEHHPADDGSSVEMSLTEWPIEFVKWDESRGTLLTRVRDEQDAPITHGDGHWIVFAKHKLEPWKQDACLLPGALIFASHLDGVRDWAGASRSHGLAKVIGELPEGVSLQDIDEGTLSPEAAHFLEMLSDLVSGDAGAGLRPAGSKVDFVSNGSSAWQVFHELLVNREKAAARVYLGTDGMLGSVGGAPGVDIAALFGVATTKIQGDLDAIEDGLYSGLYVPWTAINFGSSRYAPRLRYQLPDPDEEKHEERETKRRESTAASRAALLDAITRYRELGLVVTQGVIDQMAIEYGVTAPTLAAGVESPAPQPPQ